MLSKEGGQTFVSGSELAELVTKKAGSLLHLVSYTEESISMNSTVGFGFSRGVLPAGESLEKVGKTYNTIKPP